MRTFPKEPDMSVPAFIRSTEDYKNGLFDFNDRSKNLICFAAYYYGECFVRTYPQLEWTTGNRELYQSNMPVVTGFSHEKELPVILVIENTFRRVIKNPAHIEDIDTTGSVWEKNIP